MAESRLFHYRIKGQDVAHEVTVVVDGETLSCVEPQPVARPWTQLACHQCPNCPLDAATTPLCPFAARIESAIAPLHGLLSHEHVTVEADCGNRRVTADTTAQVAAGSLIGLIGAISGCPHTAFLKPMAWFHLPLATVEETLFRSTASYLLAQYFANEQGRTPDWDLAGLKQRYGALQTVNVAMAARLREAGEKDAGVNGIVRLDIFAKSVPWSIDDLLDELRPLYAAAGL